MSEVRIGSVSPEAYFAEALRAGRLEVQVCRSCGLSFFFPRTHCTHCRSPEYAWRPMRAGATLYSFSEIPATPQAPARNVILADMDEGFRMMSTLIDDDELRIGMRLTARPDPQRARVVFEREAP
ncbi:Zn-ribbon domain-containing OB-fold protein [Achromobacter deleyi]|uniref:Zn-ribbon domain-containing OB-fold protein n=1 Tax=Achromobacter deleyi TaxID=1353891 RepID=UPI0014914D03|nr:zinc ribbon domain-containing protein [Achromobacter deleyi]QVQ26375.1 OB-fold domain-containing protein [Achromobacter deleyi]UIP21939.1 zinc ribbon domain-containing protein [Achromobacter deleyi]